MLRLLAVAVSVLPNLVVAQVAALDNEADAETKRVLRGVWAQIAALEPDNEALDAGSDGEDSDHEQTAESGAEEPPQAEEAEEEPPQALQQLDATDEAAGDSSSSDEEGAADADTEGPDASAQLLLADVDSDSDSDTGAETPDTEMGKLLPEMGHRHQLESERNRDMLGEPSEFSQHRRTTHNYELERKLRGEHARATGLWREVKQLKRHLRSATSKVRDLQHQLQDSRTPRSGELMRGLRRELTKEKRLKKTLASMQHQWRHQLDIEHLKLADAEKHSDTLLTSIRNLKNETQFLHAVIQEKDATRLAEERRVAEWRAKLNNATRSSAQHTSDEHHRDIAELARARAERDKAEADLKEAHAEYGAEKAQVEQMKGNLRNLLQAQDNFAVERRTLSKEVNESRKELSTERSKAAAMHLKVVEEGSELTVAQAQIRDVNKTLVKLTELDTNTSQKLIKTRAKLAVLSGELKAAEAEVGQLREERARLVQAQKADKAHQDKAVRSMNDRVNQYAGILNSAHTALDAKVAALNATRKELTEMAKQASMTRAELDQRDRQLNASYKALSDKVHEISSLRAEAAQKDHTLGAARALVGEKENQLTALRATLGKVDADLNATRLEVLKKGRKLNEAHDDLLTALNQVKKLQEQSHRLQADCEELKRRGLVEVMGLKEHLTKDDKALVHTHQVLTSEDNELRRALANLSSTSEALQKLQRLQRDTEASQKAEHRELLKKERELATVRVNLTAKGKALKKMQEKAAKSTKIMQKAMDTTLAKLKSAQVEATNLQKQATNLTEMLAAVKKNTSSVLWEAKWNADQANKELRRIKMDHAALSSKNKQLEKSIASKVKSMNFQYDKLQDATKEAKHAELVAKKEERELNVTRKALKLEQQKEAAEASELASAKKSKGDEHLRAKEAWEAKELNRSRALLVQAKKQADELMRERDSLQKQLQAAQKAASLRGSVTKAAPAQSPAPATGATKSTPPATKSTPPATQSTPPAAEADDGEADTTPAQTTPSKPAPTPVQKAQVQTHTVVAEKAAVAEDDEDRDQDVASEVADAEKQARQEARSEADDGSGTSGTSVSADHAGEQEEEAAAKEAEDTAEAAESEAQEANSATDASAA